MKKARLLGIAGVALALGGAGLTTNHAADAVVTIDPGTGSSVTCNIAGTAKLSPTLVNDWVQADHQADPATNATLKAAIASIPDNTFNAGTVPVTTTSKVASTSCSGTVTDGTHTDSILSASIGSSSTSAGTSPATCSGLASPGSSTFTSIIKWKTVGGAKLADTTVNSTLATITSPDAGFGLTSVSITGSFAGGSSTSNAFVDGATISAIAAGAPDSNNQNTGVCWPALSATVTPAAGTKGDSVKVSIKKPKGFKQIGIGAGFFTAAPSTLSISK